MNLHFDIFSGKPNPSFQIPDIIGRKVFELIKDHGLIPQTSSAGFPAQLGYRGFGLELPADLSARYGMPLRSYFTAGLGAHRPMLAALATLTPLFTVSFAAVEIGRILKLCLDSLSAKGPAAITGSAPMVEPPMVDKPCSFEQLPYDPKPWNAPGYKNFNNCYAYATNKLALYAKSPQPGLGSGSMYASLAGSDVAAAAKRDGAHDVNECFPESEAPRLLVALVIWPGEDYHWYRKHPTCWGHKVGPTEACNVDQSGKVITDPQTCDRGKYTEFTGFMLIPKSQKVACFPS